MSAKILDGKIVRDQIAKNLKFKIENLKLKPRLVIIQVGDNPESNAYIGQKIKFGERIGALVEHKKFPENIANEDLKSYIRNVNSDSNVHGIIVQMPIPNNLDKEEIINAINPNKDVDGLTLTNEKLLHQNSPNAFVPATAKGVITILQYYKTPIRGKKVAVVGRSKLVGAPVALLLKNLGATVEVGHSQTPDLTTVTKPADIIVVAVGRQNLITKNHVSPGQTVIDVGINVIEPDQKAMPLKTERLGLEEKPARKLTGDVNFDEVSEIVDAISPVPGGVGPMTVASLFENLLEAYNNQTKI